MEESLTSAHDNKNENLKHEDNKDNVVEKSNDKQNVRILSVDKITVEKIVLEEDGTRQVLLTKSESTKKLSESTSRRVSIKSRPDKYIHRNKKNLNGSTDNLISGGKFNTKEFSKLPIGRVHKTVSIGNSNIRRISPIKLPKSLSIGSFIASEKSGKNNSDLLKVSKVPPIIPPKPIKKDVKHENEKITEEKKIVTAEDESKKLIASVEAIERLQKNLAKIDSSTAEAYKQKLPIFNQHVLRFSPIPDLDLNENVTKTLLDKDSFATHGTDRKLKTEGDVSETDNIVPIKPRYSKAVTEVEKRWSGEYLDHVLERNSSGSSKSSYVEELGSISSHDSILEDIQVKSYDSNVQLNCEKVTIDDTEKNQQEEIFENTVSTIDTNSCVEERIKAITEDFDEDNEKESVASTLNESSATKTCQDSEEFENDETLVAERKAEDSINNNKEDAYANLIKEITMEAGSSRGVKDEKKKKSGFRRLLPGIFSPKDSRKDYKKDHKERRKRDVHFNQHQQNGVYTRSPDTMNLNEDIKRNVNLDTSLNGSIIEERLNEIKQELFPDQGMTTSTPDHFLQTEHIVHHHGRRTPRIYTTNSSLSSIAVEDKWIDQNIISGSPDMRKFKQNISMAVNDNDQQKCGLERKHSFQDPQQQRFFRNHGPSGRISAPPSERYLIRPRAVHPVDRPLPAIPQKIEFSNYENQEGIQQHSVMNYQETPYYSGNQNYANEVQYFENGNHIEKPDYNRNRTIDSSYNMTPHSGQAKVNKQYIINQQNAQKMAGNIARSPKYSPSSSQKSGDYADSSYTPNSSQKSEFSPGSSKSGEYYLHSPRNSCRTSPDSSFNDRRDLDPTSYQVPSNIRVHPKAEPLYDEAPRSSPFEPEKLSPSPRQGNQSISPEVPFTQKASPNIPLSSNLAKLRANMETTRSESPKNLDNQSSRIATASPVPKITISPDKRSATKSPVPSSPRVTSPLTILPPSPPPPPPSPPPSNSQCVNITPSPSRLSIQTNQGQVSSPTMWNTRSSSYGVMSTFQPRKAQPNDQILIASPKREIIYETQQNQVSNQRENRKNMHTLDKLDDRNKSPTPPEIYNQPPQAFQDKPTIDVPEKEIQRPEPLYVRRQEPAQRPMSPVNMSMEKKDSQVYEERPNMLLVKASSDKTIATSFDAQQEVGSPGYQSNKKTPPKNISQVTSPRSATPEIRKYSQSSPEQSDTLHLRKKDPSPSHERPQGIYGDQRMLPQNRSTSNEQIYGIRPRQLPLPQPTPQRHEVQVHQQKKTQSPRQLSSPVIYSPTNHGVTIQNKSPEQIYGWKVGKEPIYAQRNQQQDPIYSHNFNRQLSPSKKQTLQNLEAYYWQQKALETSRSSTNSPTTSNRSTETNTSGGGPPEVREAIYWHQLKKLDEEQQRKMYEKNQFEEKNEMMKKNIQNPTTSSSSINESNYNEQIYWKNEMQNKPVNMATKPPIAGQKGQNQPVLVVRPQQAVRDINQNQMIEQPRSQSVSPHFIRGDERRSLQLPRRKVTIENDDGGFNESKMGTTTMIPRKATTLPGYDDNEDKKNNPPPIFKRGSLISNSSNSVDYGTMGTKRVSFSNQANSPEIGTGHWPTKHGMAPEPPTRKHRTEEKTADSTDLAYSSRVQEENQNNNNNIYGNTTYSGQNIIYQTEYDAKPLPPTPRGTWTMKRSNSMRDSRTQRHVDVSQQSTAGPVANSRKWPGVCESESGSEAGDPSRNLQSRCEEEWNPGGKGRQSNDTGTGRAEGEGGSNDLPSGRRILGSIGGGRAGGTGGGGGRSRDEPRRHTLSGDHAPSLHHQQFNSQQLHPLHPHHLPPPHGGQYGTLPNRHTTMDLEMGSKSRQRKSPLPRGYPPPSTAMLFDDDPGIMSEVETSSTGFRRGGKQRSSLPVVRTPSKTLERPLGLVFLQYRKETKRALLPNEITSIDTVKALFVRSFPKQLTMEYLDMPDVKIYIHDSNKDMFYELEDHRSHLRDIRDRSVLRLIEKTDGLISMPGGPVGVPVGGQGLPPHWEDPSYFSEPEFDSEFQHQHIHKSKSAKNSTSGSYYMGGSSTLPRGGSIMRAYSPASAVLAGPNATPTQPKTLGTPDRIHGESGYMSSPERSGGVSSSIGRYPTGPYSTGSSYEEPYYSQYSGTVTPVIDEEASDTELLEDSYSLYGVKPSGRPPSGPPRSPFPPGAPALPPGPTYDVTRIRVEHMERQLANLTGLVQKALTHAPHPSPSPRDYLQVPAGRDPYARSADDSYLRTDVKPPKLGKDKSVSFEKSVSFSDEPPDMNSPKQHSPQHAADTKPTKPAIKSSTLPRMSSQERDRHKPTPPPKPVALASGTYVYRDLALTPEMYNQLRGLQKKAKDLRQEVRNLRRMSQAQAHTVRETIRDTFITIRSMLLTGGDAAWAAGDTEKIRLSREEDLYKQEMIRLENDLTELESTVEELRGNVINRKTRVNMSDVENMALILSKSSKTVADLKVRFPSLQEGMKGLLSSEMEKVVREEKFLKEEPDRLESALRRCKKLTGTLVTLKRLASVQEQRLPNAVSIDTEETPPITPTSAQHSKTAAPVPAERTHMGSTGLIGGGSHPGDSSTPYQQRPENALDALLDELQTFSRPSSQLSQVSSVSQQSNNHMPTMLELGRSASQVLPSGRAPNISEIGRKGSIDSSSSLAILPPGNNTLRRLHSYPSSSDTDTSPPIARNQLTGNDTNGQPAPPQKPPVPERNAELLQLATARRVPPPPPPRTSSRSPLASPTSPQLPPRNPTSTPGGTLRRGRAKDTGKPPMALPPGAIDDQQPTVPTANILSTSNSSSCESINSQEGMQNKKGRQEQLEQRHQELLKKQKALQEQYARLQQLQRNASGLATVPPTPPDLLKKTGSESNILAKMGLGMSTASSGSLTSLTINNGTKNGNGNEQQQQQGVSEIIITPATPLAIQTTTNKVYETDIL